MLSGLQTKLSLASNDHPTEVGPSSTWDHEIITPENVGRKVPAEVIDHSPSDDVPDETAQAGVAKAEAITLTWTKTSLGVAYVL